jgi:hypothetical protein
MENKIPAAEEFWITFQDSSSFTVPEAMIEFAKLHVEAALKDIINNVETCIGGDGSPLVTVTSILNAYPLTNIK